jgi:hypothetical protein
MIGRSPTGAQDSSIRHKGRQSPQAQLAALRHVRGRYLLTFAMIVATSCRLEFRHDFRHELTGVALFVVAMIAMSPTQPAVAMTDTASDIDGSAFFAPDRHESHPIAHPGHPAHPTRPATQPTAAFFAHEATSSHRGSHRFADPGYPAYPAPVSGIGGSGRQPTYPAGVDTISGTVSGLIPTSAPYPGGFRGGCSPRGRTRGRSGPCRSIRAVWDKL